MIFGRFSSVLSQRLFFYNLSSELYQVDASKYLKDDKASLASPNRVTPMSTSVRRLSEESKVDIFKVDVDKEWDILENNGVTKSHHTKDASEIAIKKRIEVIDSSFQSMVARRMYNYSAKDVCYNVF